jgi:hypothetical protein
VRWVSQVAGVLLILVGCQGGRQSRGGELRPDPDPAPAEAAEARGRLVFPEWEDPDPVKLPANFPILGDTGMGCLHVMTQPWTRVSIDGEFLKNTPVVNHPLSAGLHEITLENEAHDILITYPVLMVPEEDTFLVRKML